MGIPARSIADAGGVRAARYVFPCGQAEANYHKLARGQVETDMFRALFQSTKHLAKSRRFAIAMLVVLVSGLAGTGALVAFFSTLWWTPVALPRLESLVSSDFRIGNDEFTTLRDSHLFEGVAAYYPVRVTAEIDGSREVANASLTTAELFAVLGIRPSHGRFFSPAEAASSARVAVVSARYWSRLLA